MIASLAASTCRNSRSENLPPRLSTLSTEFFKSSAPLVIRFKMLAPSRPNNSIANAVRCVLSVIPSNALPISNNCSVVVSRDNLSADKPNRSNVLACWPPRVIAPSSRCCKVRLAFDNDCIPTPASLAARSMAINSVGSKPNALDCLAIRSKSFRDDRIAAVKPATLNTGIAARRIEFTRPLKALNLPSAFLKSLPNPSVLPLNKMSSVLITATLQLL